ncbi:MAG: GtrA family protein [Verrucomicrobiota bacterium]
MTSLIKEAWYFYRDNDFKTVLAAINSKDAHPTIQFLKYATCGAIATVASMGTWIILVLTVLPAMDWMKINGEPITDSLRARNSAIANIIGWIFGNFVAYFTNVIWVFKDGRHSKWLEFVYFTVVSGIATIAGLAAGPLLIELFGIHTILSQGTLMVTAVLVNYLCRKFFIFKS